MRVAIVGFMAFLFMGFILWLCGAFISAVWNPMLWDGFGRFVYVLMVFCIALPTGVGAGAWYDDEQSKQARRC